MTQVAVCLKMHISVRSLQNYESGARVPPFDIVEQMAKLYDCPIEFFTTKE